MKDFSPFSVKHYAGDVKMTPLSANVCQISPKTEELNIYTERAPILTRPAVNVDKERFDMHL